MLNHIHGIIEEKSLDRVVLEAAGVGYELLVPISVSQKLGPIGHEVKLFVVESVAMYSGTTKLYGFTSDEERGIFLLLKEEVPGAGAKKALDYFDKVIKSLPDFKSAVVRKDVNMLCSVFGFTKKTAEKVVSALKDKIGEFNCSGKEKWESSFLGGPVAEALAGLVALGYREAVSRDALEKLMVQSTTKDLTAAQLIKLSLKNL